MWGLFRRQKYNYKVRFTDSIDDPYINQTEISSDDPVSKAEAEDLLREQMEANNIYPEWVRVISLQDS
ncbi:hypothetical protein [Laspinema olomoucense]|uniref:hypothetical protein n=1 Tax=Laspinema olomoucense TaxID=3231600 RepID=UPI0021BAF457|nr:hypothetical protein [Laspinema sp. D3d]MCT7971105.1 hypothetical protein [Laspinema sp. D3d]